jgi:hypothetical protein
VNSLTAVDPDSEWNSESSRWEDNFYSQDVENINEGAIEAGGEDPDSEWNSDSSRVEVVRSALVIGQAMTSLDEGVGNFRMLETGSLLLTGRIRIPTLWGKFDSCR